MQQIMTQDQANPDSSHANSIQQNSSSHTLLDSEVDGLVNCRTCSKPTTLVAFEATSAAACMWWSSGQQD
jgi:hypothetical protein